MTRGIVSATFAVAVAVGLVATVVPVHGVQTTANKGAAGGGTIQGHVKLTGPAPANPPIRMGADPLCAKLARESGKRPVQELVVTNGAGGLANAFVELQGTFTNVPAAPKDPVVIRQQGCVYSPRVVGIRVGQTLRLVNADTLLHNLHAISAKGNGFNHTQPQSGAVDNFVMKAAETMVHMTCDVHSWMSAWIGVETHPYFAVSGADGSFTIANAPAGRHTIRAWQERFGWITKTVDVKPGATTTVELSYTGAEKPAPKAQELVIPEGTLALLVRQ
jgi:plastocyanin